MIAEIVQKPNNCICGNCRIVLFKIVPQCPFCGALFSNYENFLIKEYEDGKRELGWLSSEGYNS